MTAVVCLAALALPPLPGYARVPVERGGHTGWWYVRAAVNGRPATLMLDTGGGHNEWYGPGPAGDLAAAVRLGPAVAVGEFSRTPTPAAVAGEPSPAGLGGLPLLAGLGAVMDFGRGRLYVARSGAGPAGPALRTWGLEPVPLVVGRLRYLAAAAAGRPLTLAVDSGGSCNCLFADSAGRAGVWFGLGGRRFTVPSGFGPLRGRGVVGPGLALAGGRPLPRGEFHVLDRPAAWDEAVPGGRRFDGVVGLPWLRAAGAVLDVADNSLYLPAADRPVVPPAR